MRKTTPLAMAGLAAASALIGRRSIRSWESTADPEAATPLRLRDGQSQFVELADGARIHVASFGVTGPALLAVHGLTASHHDWSLIVPKLVRSGFRVFAVDQRGHGRSTRGTAGFGSEQLGRDLEQVIDALGVDFEALIGHSMGGMAIFGLAARTPRTFDWASRVVLIATDSSLDDRLHQVALRLGGLPLVPDDPSGPRWFRRIVARLGVFGEAPPIRWVDTAVANYFECPADVVRDATAALASHDLDHIAETLPVPVLLIGAGRDRLIFPRQIRALHDRLPDSTLTMYDDAGHMVIWERAADIAAEIVAFVQADSSPVATGRVGSDDHPLHDPT